MLLGRPKLRNAKVIHDWANDQIQIMGNGTIKIVKINRQLGYEAVTPHALVCYNFEEGITDDEESILLATDPTLQPMGTIDWDVLSSQLPTSADGQTLLTDCFPTPLVLYRWTKPRLGRRSKLWMLHIRRTMSRISYNSST